MTESFFCACVCVSFRTNINAIYADWKRYYSGRDGFIPSPLSPSLLSCLLCRFKRKRWHRSHTTHTHTIQSKCLCAALLKICFYLQLNYIKFHMQAICYTLLKLNSIEWIVWYNSMQKWKFTIANSLDTISLDVCYELDNNNSILFTKKKNIQVISDRCNLLCLQI